MSKFHKVMLAAAGLLAVAIIVMVAATWPAARAKLANLWPAKNAVMIRVAMTEWRYEPAVIRVIAGQKYKLIVANKGVVDHAFVVDASAIDTGRIAPGHEEVVEFEAPGQPGLYEIYSSVPGQRQSGLTGSLAVAENTQTKQLPPDLQLPPGPSDQPGGPPEAP